ncbi:MULTISPECIES: class I SAM-dependent methyltransferase [Zhongshania]|jgi:SAM-dependent methyltransferase|uniref:SAM-dependent methyltransferase n=1 Tax=Zhongshania antarctica TaxID=641702 RepID=A0A840R549_9GAMM|nr:MULTISPECIES: class I SAM-dependent methyltransferase [Zhongshania]MBB5187937.1 SAM-dependent methyltransferase [Zhongshania antarctica]
MAEYRDALTSKTKWNLRHQQRSMPASACSVLEQHRNLLPATGRALDIACGLGGNAVLLAQAGLLCDAMDISDIAVSRLNAYAQNHSLAISASLADIENDDFTLAAEQYDVIVVSYFLYRPLFSIIATALKPGGLLFYQTFSNTADRLQCGPKTPDFYLQERELLSQFKGLEIQYYHEGENTNSAKTSFEAALVARKPRTKISI